MADEYLPQIVFTVEESAARREAEQLRVLQARSTETVDKLRLGRKPNSFTFCIPGQLGRSKKLQPVEKLTVSEQAVHAMRRRQAKHCSGRTRGSASDSCSKDGERLDPVDSVGDFTHYCCDIRPVR